MDRPPPMHSLAMVIATKTAPDLGKDVCLKMVGLLYGESRYRNIGIRRSLDVRILLQV